MDEIDLMVIGDFLKSMFILLVIFIGIGGVFVTVENIFSDANGSLNITESIIDKQISYDSKYHENRYFIFTDNYCFDVTLTTYNSLKVGDNVTLIKYKYLNRVTLKYNDYIYNNE